MDLYFIHTGKVLIFRPSVYFDKKNRLRAHLL
jgi:hypothetical protein